MVKNPLVRGRLNLLTIPREDKVSGYGVFFIDGVMDDDVSTRVNF